jgi:hypothetical protein
VRLTPHLAIYTGIFLVFLATGVWSGRMLGSSGIFLSTSGSVSNTVIAARTPTNITANDQHNLLVIGVDQLENAHPQLESVWLVMFFPGKPDFIFLPVFPMPGGQGARMSSDIQENFSLDSTGRPDQAFLQQLSDWIWWNNFLVIDQKGIISLIDMIGGIPLHKGHLNGSQVIAKLASSPKESNAAFESQVALLEGICTQIHNPPSKKEIATLVQNIKTNMITDLDLNESMNNWLNQNDKSLTVRCEFPLTTSSIP